MLGAICGDILGSVYEFEEIKYHNPGEISLCTEKGTFTDDTILTLAVADWLLHDVEESRDDGVLKGALARQFVKYAMYTFDRPAALFGFGVGFFRWLAKADLIGDFSPYQSYGNGAGMRVSPVGWFFDTMEETLHFAKLTADVTHDHPEGERGAMCVAAAVFLARKGKSKEEIKAFLRREFGYALLDQSVAELREACTWSAACQDTVPMAMVAFLESHDYESAIQNAICYGSDSDTIADMAGAVAEAFYGGVPRYIADACLAKLPPAQQELVAEFYSRDAH